MAVSKSIAAPRAFQPDERQRQAIEHVHGPLLVVAGAGTGKTTVLTQRIASLIREKHARPHEILALTYTDNAAREMRERVRSQLQGSDLEGLRCRTFHAYCNELLIENGKQFGVVDDNDLWIYLRKRIRDLNLNHFVRAANVGKFLHDLLDFMRRCHDELVGPAKYAEYVRQVERGEMPLPRVCKSKDSDDLPGDEALGRCQEISSVYATVERMLLEHNLGTFGHMITRAYELLEQDAELLAREQKRARFILVDEFQDANFAQVRILQKLAGDERNVFAVGDPDQAIYQFRGASSAAFTLFLRHFPGTGLVVLEKNRRSTSSILQSAFAVIDRNPEIFSEEQPALPYRRSPLVSAREEEAADQGNELLHTPVDAVVLTSRDSECSDLVSVIEQRRRQTRSPWKKFAVLYRQHSHHEDLVKELIERCIPFSIDNMDVLNTPEVRDLLACLAAVVSLNDGANLFRVAALPQFSVNPEELRAGMRGLPRDADSGGVARVLGQIAGGATVLDTLQQAREEIARTRSKAHAALQIIMRRFALPLTPPVQALLKFVTAWEGKAIVETGEVGELVEYLKYFRESGGTIPKAPGDEDAVRLMTVHTAKGLEWDHVFILRGYKPSFPLSYREALVEFPPELRDADSAGEQEGKARHEQEERRLFYVAMTRARDSLTIYAPEGRGKTEKTPAGYLRELLYNKALHPWFRKRDARAHQRDIFAEAQAPAASSRTSDWLSLPAVAGLGEKLSASAVQTYETCPLQFRLEREWKIPSDVPGAMQYGAAMHRVLRTYYDSVRFQREISDDALIDLFRSDLEQAGIQDRYQHDLYQKQGVEQLRDFLAACRRAPAPEVLHLEEWFDVRIGGVTVTGRIDRIDRLGDGQVVITDYKTGKPRSQEDADESLQLSIYALAAREKWGYRPVKLVFYNLEENARAVTARNEKQLEEAKRKVEAVAKNIAEGNFKASIGFHCNFCAYRNLCPATEKRAN